MPVAWPVSESQVQDAAGATEHIMTVENVRMAA